MLLSATALVSAALLLPASHPALAVLQVNGNQTLIGTGEGGDGTEGTLGTSPLDLGSDTVFVGTGSASGSLTISAGGSLSNENSYLGFSAGSTGTVMVTGADSALTSSIYLYVGGYGAGELTVSDGGSVSSKHAYVGVFSGSTGTVTVKGAESALTISSNFSVGNESAGDLTVSDGGSVSVTSGGGTITVGDYSGSTGTINIGAAAGVAAAAAGMLYADNIVFGAGAGTLVFNHTSTAYHFDLDVSGAGSANVLSGTTILTGANSFTGGTTISGGTLQLGDGGTSGSLSGNVVNDGTLIFNRSNAVTHAGVITGTGSVTKAGAGKLILTGANSYSGGTTVSGGVLQAGSAGALAANTGYTVNGGTLDLGNFNLTASSLSGTGGRVDLGGAALTVAQTGNTSYAGAISGTGSVTKAGAGTLVLTGANSYSGGTTVSGGVLQAGSAGALAANTGYTVNGGTLDLGNFNLTASSLSGTGGRVDLGGAALTVAQSGTTGYAGVITGTGSVTKAGAGTLVLTGANTYSGGTTISAGTLQVGDGGTSGSLTGDVTNDSALIFNRSNAVTHAGVITGTGSVTKAGAGTLVLTGANSYSGGTTVSGGVLRAGSAGALAANTGYAVNGGTLDLGGFDLTASSLSGTGGSVDLGGAALTVAQSGTTGYAGAIIGTGSLTKAGTGTLVLSGANTHTGGTTISAGTVQVGDGGTSGSLSGNVVNEGTLAFNRSDAVTYAGAISGTGSVTKAGAGTLVLTGANTYSGGTTIQAGTLQIGDGGATGALAGDVTNNGALAFNRSDAIAFDGAISGAGTVTKTGAGTLVLSGDSTHTGGTTISAGTLQLGDGGTTGALAGDVTNNGALAFNRSDAIAFDGAISGAGTVTKAGAGTLVLSGANSYTGGTTVSGGGLVVNGSLAGTLALASGTFLGGSGTVSDVTLASGATLAPGNSIGTLNAGDVTFSSGSTYEVEVDASARSDKLVSTGTVTIDSGATLTILAENRTDDGSTYDPKTSYTVLSASAVTGSFGTVTENFAFLDAGLDYSSTDVTLTLRRNDIDFKAGAGTQNQRNVAKAIQDTGSGQIYDAVLTLPDSETEAAFQQMTGEMHASLRGALVTGATIDRAAMNQRLLNAFGQLGASGDQASMGFHGAGSVPALAQLNAQVWSQAFGGWGEADATATTARMTSYGGGFVGGLDAEIFPGWRTGVMAGYSHSQFTSTANGANGSADSYHAGVYAGTRAGAFGLRLGASYTLHQLDTSRTVAFPGFTDRLSAGYTGSTAQAFVEAGYTLDTRFARLEPFAGLALVNQHSDGFTESGGAAALTSRSTNDTIGVTTLGLRGESVFATVHGFTTSLTGSLAWRHAFGDVEPRSAMRFASGGAGFAITGTPIDADTALVEAGLSFAKDDKLGIALTYQGELGANAQDHTGRASLRYRF
ncbi:autotransporter-associated beta strand repeat-containing protein [Breoghania sp. L-A4]|uniref:autotransporter-associated beta strand repeat-containing protein n=1 Tax=Breoghania sp. L-A4 TaxID=2304600 RepID=UPI0013C30039|nr:autotransporter-associated beta strand repeat-containing protein [Breoghania sp. L-A4]